MPAQPLQHDLVGVEDVAVFVRASGHLAQELAQPGLEPPRDVLEDPADLEVARVHALTGGHLEQVEDQLPLAQAVEEDRDRAEVERARSEPDQVRGDAVQLEVDDAQILAPGRYLHLGQRLDGGAVGHRVEVVGEVVHPLDHGDDLPVGLVLGGLLDAGVHVADDRFEVSHDLALERHEQAQDPVCGRVVGTEVERQQLVVGLLGADLGDLLLDRRERDALLAAAVLGEGCRAALARSRLAHVPSPLAMPSLNVNLTGSPPTGKSRRSGWPS